MSKNKKLGMGLKSLFGNHDYNSGGFDDKVTMMSMTKILPNPNQPRKVFNEEKLQELAESIRSHGVLSPIILQKKRGEMYYIVAGERRFRAAKILGLNSIPVIKKDIDSTDLLEVALIENIQRDDLNHIEEAEACSSLIDSYGYTHETLAKKIGKNRTHLTNLLRILKLPKKAQEFVSEGKISLGHAKILVGRKDALDLCSQIINKGLSVRELENLVSKKNTQAISYIKSEDLKSLEEMISRKIKFRVKIKAKANRSGEVLLKFSDFNELDSILQILNNTN
ncbi:MAG: ParB/RepB/Spo0J family partition protein [Rickettsiales bacterium]